MYTFKIRAILERDEITPKESHQFRVGRVGRFIDLQEGVPMFFEYLERPGMLITSPIVDFKEDDYGVWVTTKNSVYRLDHYTNQI